MRKTTLKVGDLVVMNDKYYESESHKGEVFRILKIGTIGGESVAWLDGFSGCYALDGLEQFTNVAEYYGWKLE